MGVEYVMGYVALLWNRALNLKGWDLPMLASHKCCSQLSTWLSCDCKLDGWSKTRCWTLSFGRLGLRVEEGGIMLWEVVPFPNIEIRPRTSNG